MINIITEKKIALDSPDHINPAGCLVDNNSNLNYIHEIKNYFSNKNINVLDLGCAGGQIIVDHLSMEDLAIGLEGSSNVLHGRGKHNWEKYENINLFLCDITEPFQCLNENNKIQFDVIQMWDVLEHIPENKLNQLFKNIYNHLKNDGIFIGSISQQIDELRHVSVFSKEKWKSLFYQNNLIFHDCILNHFPRVVCDGSPGYEGFTFLAKK